MKPTMASFPLAPVRDGDDAANLFPRGCVTTVVGRLERIDVGWAGRLNFVLQLSVGRLVVTGNREQLDTGVEEGAWVEVKLMRRHDPQAVQPVALRIRATERRSDTAWVPCVLHHRLAYMQRLRSVLSALEPGLQAAFMVTMLDRQVQRRFVWRVAADDHHCYPGGLFDQSVCAAELAHAQQYADEHERGVATFAALLFDLGKCFDNKSRPDKGRLAVGVEPHSDTAARLDKPLQRLDSCYPALAAELRLLLAPVKNAGGGPISPVVLRLRQRIAKAVGESWSLGGWI